MGMTVKEAFDSIVEDGIALGAGDFVDPEALEVAATILAKVLRGHLVKVVRCKNCKKEWCYLRQELGPEGFCSAGEMKP